MPPPYYSPDDPTAEQTLYAQAASAYVQDLAPVPDPEPDDYADKAEAAEFLVYNYLVGTSGALVTSESARGVSASYATIAAIAALIAPVMGEYFEGPASGVAANTGYVEDFA